ncbi:hypothetical protein [Nostoc piscinale]|uniref:hypothetical protein n=1 Tax=Nostoc piscinale TaxID=224012 RepID=UPI00130EAB8C|nr:hypothetical protein [Nostoc piscinale]
MDSFEGVVMQKSKVIAIGRRKYKRALLEMQRAIELELESLEKDGDSFESSDGI